MEWLLIILHLTLFSVIIFRVRLFHHSAIRTKFFLSAFGLKVIFAWSYYLLYKNYGIGGDSIEFLSNGKFLTDLFSTDKKVFFNILTATGNYDELFPYYEKMPLWFSFDIFYNDSHTLIRLNALLNFITGSYYMVNAIWFAFFSMVGSTALFQLFAKAAHEKSALIFAAVFFVPSTVFWTAGISKEAWLVFLLGIFLCSLFHFYKNKFSLKYLLISLLTCYLLIYIKIYFLLALIPPLVSFLIADRLKNSNPFFAFCGVYIVAIIILMWLPGFDFIDYVCEKQSNFISYTAFMQSKSLISIPVLENNWMSFFKNAPVALWNIFTRPYLWEAKSFFWLFPSIENIFIILLMIAGFLGLKFNSEYASFSYACLFFTVSIFVLIGLTTPVIGSLLRYKAPLIPFLLMFFIFHFDWERLKARIKFQK